MRSQAPSRLSDMAILALGQVACPKATHGTSNAGMSLAAAQNQEGSLATNLRLEVVKTGRWIQFLLEEHPRASNSFRMSA